MNRKCPATGSLLSLRVFQIGLFLISFIRSTGIGHAAFAFLLIHQPGALVALPRLAGGVELLGGAAGCNRQSGSSDGCGQDAGTHAACSSPTTLIIQAMPKRSVSMPKRGDQKVLVSGICTWPPSDSAEK